MQVRSRIARHVLEITVFVCGAIVMIYEINGSRILAPHIGTSTYVWTSLIGVILAALSFGYWFGGRVADRRPDVLVLAATVFAAGGAVSLTILVKDLVLAFIASAPLILEVKSVVAAVLLFAPASILLGFVTPFAVKLRTRALSETGRTVGRLYALSTVGSIVGTFAAGFVLIPFVGSTRTLYLIAAGLFSVSLLLAPFALRRLTVASLLVFLFGLITNEFHSRYLKNRFDLFDYDTEYSRVQVFQVTDSETRRPMRVMTTDPVSLQSKIYLDGDDLATEYLRHYHLVRHLKPDFRHTLLIGGAGYTFPRDYLKQYAGRLIDVVEIDPGMTEIARRHFGLTDDPRLRIIHEDGRTFLNRAPFAVYDAVFLDAFTALFSIPFHLTTREAAEGIRRTLRPGGVVIFNVGGAIEGPRSLFFRSVLATYREVFDDVLVFKVRPGREDGEIQNLIIVGKTDRLPVPMASDDPEMLRLLGHLRPIAGGPDAFVLTDDLAPVEFFNSGRQ